MSNHDANHELFEEFSLERIEGEFLLADYASNTGGKLTVVGTWSVIGPKVGPTAVAASLRVPAGQVVHFKMALLDDDGHEVIPVIQGDATAPAVQAGLPAGTLADVSIPILVGPLPQLQPGRSYEWRLWVNGETHDHWRKPFFVRPDLPMAG